MGMDSFASFSQNPLCFIVQNITTAPQKTIRIFDYPINFGDTRDLIQIPGVSESSIRVSLLKGELNHKIRAKEITVICCDLDLLQFNTAQKNFLISSGIVNGVQVGMSQLTQEVIDAINAGGGGNVTFLFKQRQSLIGTINNVNRVFTVPSPDKFISGSFNNNEFHIYITHNGHGMKEGIDFLISESGGVGTGFDTITFLSFAPIINRSILEASYIIKV